PLNQPTPPPSQGESRTDSGDTRQNDGVNTTTSAKDEQGPDYSQAELPGTHSSLSSVTTGVGGTILPASDQGVKLVAQNFKGARISKGAVHHRSPGGAGVGAATRTGTFKRPSLYFKY